MKKTVIMFLLFAGPAYGLEGPNAHFDTNKTVVLNAAQISAFAHNVRDMAREVMIHCHTDSRGSQAFNIRLAGKRCERVQKLLMKEGVESRALIVVGEISPLVKEEGEVKARRALNRRVEINYEIGALVIEPRKNRLRLMGGYGPYGLEQEQIGTNTFEVNLKRGIVGGLGYDRLLNNRLSVGAFALTNLTFGLSVGLDF